MNADVEGDVTNEEWEKLRLLAIMTAFQTGRPVFADDDGELRYSDGDREKVPADVDAVKAPIPRAMTRAPGWWSRVQRWLGGHEK